MIISLTLALIAIALLATTMAELRSARADFERDRIAFALAGDHETVALTLQAGGGSDRLRWSFDSPEGPVQVLAEAEWPKLSLAAASTIDQAALSRLDVSDADKLRAALSALSFDQAVGPGLEMADASPLWRACARSLISAFGSSKAAPALKAAAPSGDAIAWRPGDVWRVRVSSEGWVDDRLIRFSGGRARLVATIARQFFRDRQEDDRCDALFAG